MILLSNAGTNIQVADRASDTIAVGTVDGVAILERVDGIWTVASRGLQGCSVGAVTALPNGTLFAATHGIGVARSRDGGKSWEWVNNGLQHFDLWSARGGRLMGRDVVLVGAQPAHLHMSVDEGASWQELPALREVESVERWRFPPPPRIAHIKDIVVDGDRLLVGIEIGALLVSTDFGKSFSEIAVEPDPAECDIHRILVHPKRPQRFIVANGIVGLMSSDDGGKTWRRNPMPQGGNYPDAIVIDPDEPDLVFMTVGTGWPPHWYQRGRAQGKMFRSRDAGATWQRILNGLPNGQRALFSALTIERSGDGVLLFAGDTDGQIFESRDHGESWTIIADVAPLSKGEFHKALVRDRVKQAQIDDIVFTDAAAKRLAAVKP